MINFLHVQYNEFNVDVGQFKVEDITFSRSCFISKLDYVVIKLRKRYCLFRFPRAARAHLSETDG